MDQVPFYLEAFTTMFAGEFIFVGVSPDTVGFQITLRSTAIVAVTAAIQRIRIHLLMNKPMHLQIVLIFKTFAANCTSEGTMKTVLAHNVAQNFTLLFEHYLGNITNVIFVNKFFVKYIFFSGFVDMTQFLVDITELFVDISHYFIFIKLFIKYSSLFRFSLHPLMILLNQ